jgi:hypothetical protein
MVKLSLPLIVQQRPQTIRKASDLPGAVRMHSALHEMSQGIQVEWSVVDKVEDRTSKKSEGSLRSKRGSHD